MVLFIVLIIHMWRPYHNKEVSKYTEQNSWFPLLVGGLILTFGSNLLSVRNVPAVKIDVNSFPVLTHNKKERNSKHPTRKKKTRWVRKYEILSFCCAFMEFFLYKIIILVVGLMFLFVSFFLLSSHWFGSRGPGSRGPSSRGPSSRRPGGLGDFLLVRPEVFVSCDVPRCVHHVHATCLPLPTATLVKTLLVWPSELGRVRQTRHGRRSHRSLWTERNLSLF